MKYLATHGPDHGAVILPSLKHFFRLKIAIP